MDILNVLILAGAIQGLICSILLWSKGKDRLSSRLLAVLIFLFALACLNIYLMESGIKYRSTFFHMISYTFPLIVTLPVGPLIYFYVRSLLHADFRLPSWYFVHFCPVVLDLLPYLTGTVYLLGKSFGYIYPQEELQWKDLIDFFHVYIDIPRWVSVSIYLFVTVKWMVRTKKTSDQDRSIQWLRQFLAVFGFFQLIWLGHLIPYVVPSSQEVWIEAVKWYPIYIPLAILVYWLSINSFLRHIEGKSVLLKSRSGGHLSPELIHRAGSALQQAMEQDRLFLDPKLTLGYVADHTGLPMKVISHVLNQHMKKSFNEFVNGYRTDELKRRLLEPGNEHLTITGLAFDCGFNSQATLQRVFKQFTKLSPKEYQRMHQSFSLPEIR